MLPRALRIPTKELTAKFPEVLRTPLVSVRAHRNKLGHNRFAVIIGAKLGNSVRRHWLKRRVVSDLVGWPAGERDYILILQTPAATVSAMELRQAIKGLSINLK